MESVARVEKSELRPVAIDFVGVRPEATIAPPEEDCTDNWYQHWLNEGGKEYLQNDLRTKQGRKAFIDFNGFNDEWNENTEMELEETTVQQKIAYLMKLLAKKKMKDNIYHSSIEMMHRQITITQIVTASRVNHYTGALVPDSLMVQNFEQAGIISKKIPTDQEFSERLQKMLTPEDDRGAMLDEMVNVTVYYVTNPKVNVKALLGAMKIKSRHISDSKINSARPSAGSLIGAFGKKFMTSMTKNAVTCNPDTSTNTTPIQKRLMQKEAARIYKASNYNEEEAWGVCALLNHARMKEYIRNPLSEELLTNVKELLSCATVEGGTVEGSTEEKLSPPYYLDFERIANQPGAAEGKKYNTSGEIMNEYILCPPFMLYIFAGMKNITPRQAVGQKELVTLIEYTMRFHLGAQTGYSSMTKIHGAIKCQYELQCVDQKMIYEQFEMIGACVMCINMFNACLAAASYDEGLTPEERLEKVKDAANLFNGAFQTLDNTAGNPSLTSTIHHLGKCFSKNYFMKNV